MPVEIFLSAVLQLLVLVNYCGMWTYDQTLMVLSLIENGKNQSDGWIELN